MEHGIAAEPDERGSGGLLSHLTRRQRGRMLRTLALVDLIALVAVGVQPLLPDGLFAPDSSTEVLIAVGLGAVLLTAMAGLPWETWSQDRTTEYATTALLLTGIAIIGVLIQMNGGAHTELFWLYLTTTTFSAVVYQPRFGALLGVLTAATYLAAIAWAPEPIAWGAVVFRIGILTIVAFTGTILAAGLRHALSKEASARDEADHRAAALTTVAEAARAMAKLDRSAILDEVTGAVAALGYDVVGIYVREPNGRITCAARRHLPADLEVVRDDVSILWRVLDERETVTITDPDHDPAMSQASQLLGIRTAIGTPVVVQGQIAGVVIAGTRGARVYCDVDREVFELVAGQAGRALELSDEFEDQHRMLLRLQELDQARTDLLSTVSHELRTPLTIILGMSDILARSWDHINVEDKQRLLERIRDNSDSLERVISSLLDYAHIEQGRLQVRSEPFDLSVQVRTVVDRLEPLLRDHDVTVDVPEAVTVVGDARLLERVLENLVSNAARHTPPGSEVTVRIRIEDGNVRVEVSDDGPGIRPEDVTRIGERFFRGGDPETRSARGLGLGLALSREVLRLHGSDLVIRTQLGQGTTFTFTLEDVLDTAASPRSVDGGENRRLRGATTD